MRINANIPALQTYYNITRNNKKLEKSMAKLSSGLKINSAKDDSAGLSISNKLNNQVSGIEAASRNALDGISIIQVADGTLNEIHSMLQRIRELSVQGASDILTKEDREKAQAELDQLKKEIDSVSLKAEYNKIKLFSKKHYDEKEDFQYGNIEMQIGGNKDMLLNIFIPEVSIKALNIEKINILSREESDKTLTLTDDAIEKISKMRTDLGAMQNRLEHSTQSLEVSSTNLQGAVSRILDTDMAREMALMTQRNVISQAGLSILAQANQRPQQIIQLLS